VDTRRYAELFLTESRENLSAINHSLLEMERTPDAAEHIGALFRAVHTVKGMSATMGYTAVAELSHELETLLDLVRRGELAVDPPLMDALFKAADALETSIERSVEDAGDAVNVGPIVAALRAFVQPAKAIAEPTSKRTSRKKTAAPPRDASGQTGGRLTMPAGEGIVVHIRQVDEIAMRGVRAFIAVERAKTLGPLNSVVPPVEDLQAERFDREFALRVVTTAPDEEIERVIRAAGGVDRVLIDRGSGAAPPSVTPEAPADEAARVDAANRTALAGDMMPQRQHRYVRIDLQRLDTLMNLIGELVITRGRLTQLANTIADPSLDEAVAQASRLIADLQDGIMTSRMVPVWQVFDRFPRVVRDAARALGKQIEFEIDGKDIELDRSLLDEIGDPVVHLLRNAIDHGIETPERRAATGKSPTGRLTLSASRDRSAVVIRVTDDGKGIDRDAVLGRARDLGLIDNTKTELADDEMIRLIGRPGFSTAREVTDLSGRGVGIDAVYTRVRSLGGTVDIKTGKGEGTSVTVRLPVTLAIVRALLARVGDETYAIPMTHVSETVHLETGSVRTVKGREVFVLRDDVLPLVYLRDQVRLPRRDADGGQIVVLEAADRRAGMVVDGLTGQQEIVIKPYDAVRDGLSLFSGATILGDGTPALILDVSSLL
jgi:two-component system chemotaxis sensor kinase CheA